MKYKPPSTRYEWARARYLFYGRDLVEAIWGRYRRRPGLMDSPSPNQKPAQQRPQAAPKMRASISGRGGKGAHTGVRRYGERVWDESKHPRAPAGRPEGGQFIEAHRGFLGNPPSRQNMDANQVQRPEPQPPIPDQPPPNPNADPEFSTSKLDVAIGAMRGLWQSFYVDGVAGLPKLAFELIKEGRADPNHTILFETLPEISRQLGDFAGRYLTDPNEAVEDWNAARAKAEMLARASKSMLKMARDIQRLTPDKFQKLIQCPEELEGQISDELLLLALIAKEASDELNQHFKDMDAETKAYVTCYVFGMVLYEAAEAFFTGGFGKYTKSKDFGRLLKRLEDNAFIGKSPRAKAVVSKLTLKIAKLCDTQICFVAGTKVHTPRGLVNIEDLKAGDLVQSRDEHDVDLATQIVAKPVVRPIVTHPRLLWHISYFTASGATETLVTTASHPFFVLERSVFVAAAALETGQTLALFDGGVAKVKEVRVLHAAAGEVFTTYNLEIADTRTYFVGSSGVWVHNSGQLMCDVLDTLHERYLKNGLTDAQAQSRIQSLLSRRVETGRLSREAADKHWKDASRAFGPTGISKAEYSELRKQTPSSVIREAVNPTGAKVDPIYGHTVPRLEADHVVPMKQIVAMRGFNRLSKADKIAVLNLRGNFMGLSKASNASKGAKTYREWKGHSKHGPIPDDIREWLLQVETEATKALKREISRRLGG